MENQYTNQRILEMSSVIENAPYFLEIKVEKNYVGKSRSTSKSGSGSSSNSGSNSGASSRRKLSLLEK